MDHEVPEASDQMSVASNASEMEPFEDYKAKITKLLEDLKFPQCSIESLQHGYGFQNCVYALTSLTDAADQWIVRIPGGGTFDKEINERCSEIEDGVCVLNHLRDKLPVAEITKFSATPDNSLESPYAIQTRLAGQSLNHVYGSLDGAERRRMIDQYIDLVVKMESIRLATAGSLVAPHPLPIDIENSSDIPAPSVQVFDGYDTDPIEDPQILADRAGSSIKALFKSLITKYIAAELESEAEGYDSYLLPIWRKMQTMLDEMSHEGFFRPSPEPIVMHHWDLEARNIMVAQTPTGSWNPTGIIDWDEAICLPRPLARKPPAWFWTWRDCDEDVSSDESDCDRFPDRELGEEDKALKAYFDQRVEAVLPGYLEDAYGSGRLLRRLWGFIREGLNQQWNVPVCEQLLEEWDNRPRNMGVAPPTGFEPQDFVPEDPTLGDTVQAELTSEQPQAGNSALGKPETSFAKALKRGWKKVWGWIRLKA